MKVYVQWRTLAPPQLAYNCSKVLILVNFLLKVNRQNFKSIQPVDIPVIQMTAVYIKLMMHEKMKYKSNTCIALLKKIDIECRVHHDKK